jgi:uracil-DNA glycosylase
MSLWNDFTSFVINELNNCNHQIIFVAWGAFAHNKLANIDTNKHKLIISSHPSPLSVYKNYKQYPPFNNSKVFSKINKYLTENNQKSIDW